MEFRVAAAEIEPLDAGGQCPIDQRAEKEQLGAGLTEQIEIILIVEAEGPVAGHPDPHWWRGGPAPRGCRRGGGCRRWSPGGSDFNEQIEIEVLGDQPGQTVEPFAGQGMFITHVQAKVS
jgi:hypothetical protein